MTKASESFVMLLLLQAVKFAEKVITTLSEKQRHSELPKKLEKCSSLDEIPNNHSILDKNELKNMGEAILEQLLKFVASPAISRSVVEVALVVSGLVEKIDCVFLCGVAIPNARFKFFVLLVPLMKSYILLLKNMLETDKHEVDDHQKRLQYSEGSSLL